jgi:hypothetical protein
MPRITCAPNNVQQKRTKEENVRKGTMTTHLQNIQQMRVDDDATLFVKSPGGVPIHVKGESMLTFMKIRGNTAGATMRGNIAASSYLWAILDRDKLGSL